MLGYLLGGVALSAGVGGLILYWLLSRTQDRLRAAETRAETLRKIAQAKHAALLKANQELHERDDKLREAQTKLAKGASTAELTEHFNSLFSKKSK